MADTVTKSVRSRIMTSVGRKDTKPELIVRSLLHRMGFRFCLHRKDLPGTPDIVLPRYKTVIFVHGCFWHQHSGCSKSKRPSSNIKYWENKLDKNVERDKLKLNELKHIGWRILIVWECETKDLNSLTVRLNKFLRNDFK